jgi:hypothetical protein
MFSVAASGAAASSATDVVFKNNNYPVGVGLFACFKRHVTQRADAGADKAPESHHAGKHHCPCCLAASMAAAVLPERLVAPVSGPLVREGPVSYLSLAAFTPESCSPASINGARAPPSLL